MFYVVPLAIIAAVLMVLFPSRKPNAAVTVSAGSSAPLSPTMTSAAHGRIQDSYASLPLAFEQNQGQTDPQVKYLARGHGYTLFLTANDAVFSLHSRPVAGKASGQSPKDDLQSRAQRHNNQTDLSSVVHMHLLGANAQATVEGTSATPGTANYFIGNDPSKWRTGVARYARVSYQNLYPGVNMAFHGSGRELEFDFVLAPGANPAPIGLQFSGNQGVKTDDSGDLIILSAAGNVLLHKPVAYQEQNGTKQPVDARFVLKAANQVSFELGSYDRSRELVIDPSVTYAFSTYLGGSGDDNGINIAFDSNGYAYVTGETTSTNFPHASDALRGPSDAFVTKIAADGSSLIYSTYVGGDGAESGNAIAVDSLGDAFVAGGTQSANFPPSTGAFQVAPKTGNTGSAFLFELSPDGSKLIYSTYLGGSVDDVALGLALTGSGNTVTVYIVGVTSSIDFPIPTNLVPLQSASGANDGFVAGLNPGNNGASDLKFSTYLGPGGSTGAGAKAVAVDASGNVYVTGATSDATFHVTSGAYQAACGSCPSAFDAFLTIINPSANAYVYSTFLGGSGADVGFGIAVDSSGYAYIAGSTSSSTDFPIKSASPSTYGGGTFDAFVTKLNPAGTGPNDLVYSRYLGGNNADSASGIAVDLHFNAYVTGSTNSTNFPTVGPTQASLAGGSGTDAFVSEINPAGSLLLFSTYLGGTGTEDNLGLGGIAVDSTGAFIYVTGNTSSTNFPLTSAEQQTPGGGVDAFVVKYALAQSFAMSATTPAAVAPGTSATSTVSLTAYNGYSSPVHLSCSVTGAGSPAPACSASSFSPNPATPGSPAATSTLTITTTANHADNFVPRSFFYALWMPIAGLSVVGMSLTSTRSRRKKLMGLLMLGMIFTTLLMMPACGSSSKGGGGGGSGGTPAGGYTVTITGTGTDPAAITQSTQVTLTVN